MPCYRCAKPFSLLCREKACGKCGFGFCSKCLPFRWSGGPKDSWLCGSCHQRLTQPDLAPAARAPPDILLKRLERVEDLPAPNPITVYRDGGHRLQRLKKGLSVEDAAIADRLQKLQSDPDQPHGSMDQMAGKSDKELHERLARLKGVRSETTSATAAAMAPKPPISQVRQTEDLLEQIALEVQIDQNRPKPEDDIADRLAKLRGLAGEEKDSAKKCISKTACDFNIDELLEDMDEDDLIEPKSPLEIRKELRELSTAKTETSHSEVVSEEEVAKVIKECLAKADSDAEDDDELMLDEYPSDCQDLAEQILSLEGGIRCCECEQRKAALMCPGCFNDAFCRDCFEEVHQHCPDRKKHSPQSLA